MELTYLQNEADKEQENENDAKRKGVLEKNECKTKQTRQSVLHPKEQWVCWKCTFATNEVKQCVFILCGICQNNRIKNKQKMVEKE